MVGEHRLQHRQGGGTLKAKSLAGEGAAQTGDSAHGSRFCPVHSLKLSTGVDTQLVGLLLPNLVGGQTPVRALVGEQILYF